ncbi:putative 3-phosphoshikimate 1-carboxyvinyltransferase protein [Marine Group I thaumarchaeote SCGC AAA799-O18]|jgi:3-phosphoshikimate 1-carboxyvinyltransferase|nr:putative 3-phosphoshikimate 1-carboxyvinyltransferase protein [Marine Group I thaumarchaeote SCGC AAA799-O18]
MNCRVEKSEVSGTITCPSNKSYTHRAIFLASLADGKSIVKNILKSGDTDATINACKNFGVEVKETGNNITINSSGKLKIDNVMIDAANSGTTIRFATAISALSNGKTVLSGDASLKKRPMKPLLDALESLGAKCSSNNGNPPISVSGKIKGGEIQIPGNISSQFISALMITAPKLENGIILNVRDNLVSKPYLDATIIAMKKFGVNVETVIPYQKYNIPEQSYKPTTFTVPSDFSSISLLLSAAVLVGENLTIQMSMGDMPQADEAIIDILEVMGVVITLNKNTIKIKSPAKLTGGKFDLSNSPDLLPAIAILALKTSKPIKIFNVKHARYKETDRIKILARELSKLGIKVVEKNDGLILKNSGSLTGANLDSENDHRLFMAFCIAGMYVGNCIVSNPESVKISYPDFIQEMKRIGCNIFLDK